MLLFRSEEHVARWCEQRGLARGSVFTPAQMWIVAKAWYERRAAPDWRRFTLEEAQGLFERAGLTGDFWRLQPPAPAA